MKKIGVTGAAGFVGSHLCERLLAEDYEVVGVDDLSYGSMANMEPFLHQRGFTFEVLDCTQRRPLRAAFDGATRSCTSRRRRSRATAARSRRSR